MKKIIILFGFFCFLCLSINAQDNKPYYINVSTTNDSVTCRFGYLGNIFSPGDTIKFDIAIENNSLDTIFIRHVNFQDHTIFSNETQAINYDFGLNRDFDMGYPSSPFKAIPPNEILQETFIFSETQKMTSLFGTYIVMVDFIYYLNSEKLKRIYNSKNVWYFVDSLGYEYFELYEKQREYNLGSVFYIKK